MLNINDLVQDIANELELTSCTKPKINMWALKPAPYHHMLCTHYHQFIWFFVTTYNMTPGCLIWTSVSCKQDTQNKENRPIIANGAILQNSGQKQICLGYYEISMLKSMLVDKDFQTWHLIGWQHSWQPIRSHVRKPLLTNMDFTK